MGERFNFSGWNFDFMFIDIFLIPLSLNWVWCALSYIRILFQPGTQSLPNKLEGCNPKNCKNIGTQNHFIPIITEGILTIGQTNAKLSWGQMKIPNFTVVNLIDCGASRCGIIAALTEKRWSDAAVWRNRKFGGNKEKRLICENSTFHFSKIYFDT